MTVAKIVLEQTAYSYDKPYDYIIPDKFISVAKRGCRVIVPFGKGNNTRQGIIIDVTNEVSDNLKCISSVLDLEPILSDEMISMAIWMHEHLFCTYFDAIKLTLPVGVGFKVDEVILKGAKAFSGEYDVLNEYFEKVPVTTETPKPSATTTPTQTPTQTPEGTLPSSGPVVTPDSYKDIGKKIIVIDAGHGGTDPGAVSGVLGSKTVNEKDITLGIAKKLRDTLESNGYTVVMTRDSDTYPTLNQRAEKANRAGAALFVSIHMNSSPSSDPSGTETYYSEINNGDDFGITSKKLAESVQNKLYKALDSRNRGVKTANHAVTRNSIMPAILIEVGFISNAKQAELLLTSDYQQKAASAIANGIIECWDDISVPKDWSSLVLKRIDALK